MTQRFLSCIRMLTQIVVTFESTRLVPLWVMRRVVQHEMPFPFVCRVWQHKLVSKYKLGRRYYEFGKMLEDLRKGIENQMEEFQAKMLHEILMLVASLGCLAQHPHELVVRSWTLRYVHE